MTRKHGLLAGLGLILLVNAIALGGVWYNRKGEESRLLLSQREIPLLSHWQMKENSGVAMRLDWRMPRESTARSRYLYRHLSQAQMLKLGFPPPDQANSRTPPLTREVLVVLELDGPAYREELNRAKKDFEDAQKAFKARPRDKELEERLEAARKGFEQERDEASRLFVVDVGLDEHALRQHFPDRRRYAIVRGQVRPWYNHQDGVRELNGSLRQLSVERINVSAQWRERFAEARTNEWRDRNQRAVYQVEVAFGQRLEPWIAAVPRFDR